MQRTRQGELCWTDLSAKDLDGQTRFYESLFGWTHEDLPTDVGPIYRQFKLGGMTVAGASAMSPDFEAQGMPSMWATYIATSDVDALTRRTAELGGQVTMPAMDVMQQGRMAGITDPTGGMVFFWQPGVHKGAQVFGVPGSMMWADLSTRDPERAAEFFAGLLGWKIDLMTGAPMPYWQVSVREQPEGGIMPMPPQLPAGVPPNWMVYFGVASVREAVEKARALGGTAEMEPTESAGVSFAVLGDPAGAVFGIMEPMR